jgi:hypothetical protein
LLFAQTAVALEPPAWAMMHQDRLQMEWKLYLMNSSWRGPGMMSSNGRFLGSYATQALVPRRDLGDGPGAHFYIIIDDGMRLYLTGDHFDPDHVPPSGQRNGTVEFFANATYLSKDQDFAGDTPKDAFDIVIRLAHSVSLSNGVPVSFVHREIAEEYRKKAR